MCKLCVKCRYFLPEHYSNNFVDKTKVDLIFYPNFNFIVYIYLLMSNEHKLDMTLLKRVYVGDNSIDSSFTILNVLILLVVYYKKVVISISIISRIRISTGVYPSEN